LEIFRANAPKNRKERAWRPSPARLRCPPMPRPSGDAPSCQTNANREKKGRRLFRGPAPKILQTSDSSHCLRSFLRPHPIRVSPLHGFHGIRLDTARGRGAGPWVIAHHSIRAISAGKFVFLEFATVIEANKDPFRRLLWKPTLPRTNSAKKGSPAHRPLYRIKFYRFASGATFEGNFRCTYGIPVLLRR